MSTRPDAIWHPSPNYSAANRGLGAIQGIVLHDVEGSREGAFAVFAQPGGVSAHYLIDVDGTLYQSVQDRDVAYHVAAWGNTPALNRNRPTWLPAYNGRYSAVNAATIGIELAGFAAQGFTDAQYATLGLLVAALCDAYHLPRTLVVDEGATARIVSHGWLQTDRTDPGPHFDWNRLRLLLAPAQEEAPMTPDQKALLDALASWQITTPHALLDWKTWSDQTALDVESLRAEVATLKAQGTSPDAPTQTPTDIIKVTVTRRSGEAQEIVSP